MEIRHIHTLPCDLPAARRVVALGRFDGVHLGHRAVITAAASLLRPPQADESPVLLSVFTLRGAFSTPRLCDDEERYRQLAFTGADELLETDFEAVRQLSPEDFVTDFLRDTLGATAVVCGFNFRFGNRAAGSAADLCRLCEAQGIAVRVVEPVADETGGVISASRIRETLTAGAVAEASHLLGYPFTLRFPVVRGQRLGHTLGFPTINQPLPKDYIHPRFGVYASAVTVNGHVTWGVTNIGTHPTVGESVPTAETWIPEFSGDLYGQTVPVTPVKFLREETAFSSVEALAAQVRQDAVAAKRAVCGEDSSALAPAYYNGHPIKAVFFDFDDTLQNRYAAFLSYARRLMDAYFPQLSAAERETRAQWLLRENNGGYAADGSSLDYSAFFERIATRWEPGALPGGEVLQKSYAYLFSSQTRLFPDAVSTLRALREHGILVGIITNGGAVMQLQKLDHSGLRPLLDVTVVSGVQGVHKPDPEIFRRAAAYAGVAPAQCIYVGDHPVNDIQGATAAGMHPVYLDAFEKHAVSAVPRITAPGELLSLLGI